MTVNDLLLALTIVLVPVNWFTTVLLWRLSRQNPGIVSLRERAIVAIILALSLSTFALLTVLLAVGGPFDREQTHTLFRLTVLVMTLPSLYWLWIYRDPSGHIDPNADGSSAQGGKRGEGVSEEVDHPITATLAPVYESDLDTGELPAYQDMLPPPPPPNRLS